MANNCYNFIQINGLIDQIESLYSELKSTENGCDLYAELVHKYRSGEIGEDARWFDILVEKYDDETLRVSGDSAWCPCLELFTAISKQYPDLEIRYEYDEMGCDFSGWADIQNGSCSDNQFKYWEGIIAMQGEDDTLHLVIENELDCYETIEEITESDMYKAFSDENQKEIINSYLGLPQV